MGRSKAAGWMADGTEPQEPHPRPSAAVEGRGSQAHLKEKKDLWPVRDRRVDLRSRSRCRRNTHAKEQPRGSGSGDGNEGADDDLPPYQLDKNNLLTAFFNNGGKTHRERMDVYANNLYPGEYHVFGVAEVTEELITLLENIGKYRAWRAPDTDLAVFVHVQYDKRVELVASGGTEKSKYAIIRIDWDGKVGGATEAVVAVFHLHYTEARKGQAQRYDNMLNKMNAFFLDF